MVHVHRFVILRRLHDQIDDGFKCLTFLVRCEGPDTSVDRLAVRVNRYDAEEVFTTSLSGEEITFKVEEDVSWRRLWHPVGPVLLQDIAGDDGLLVRVPRGPNAQILRAKSNHHPKVLLSAS